MPLKDSSLGERRFLDLSRWTRLDSPPFDFMWRPCISNDSTLRQAFKHSLTHSFSHSLIHRHCKSPFNQSSISARPTLLSHGFLFPFQIHYIDGPHCIQIRIQIQVHSHTYTQQEHISHFIYLIVCLSVCVYVCAFLPSPGFPFGNKGHIFMAYGMKRVNWHIQIQHSSTYTIYWLCIFAILECNLENDYHNSFTNVSSP